MGIRTEYQAVIDCDDCGELWIEASYTQRMAIRAARKEGWSIGKQVKCPKCKGVSNGSK